MLKTEYIAARYSAQMCHNDLLNLCINTEVMSCVGPYVVKIRMHRVRYCGGLVLEINKQTVERGQQRMFISEMPLICNCINYFWLSYCQDACADMTTCTVRNFVITWPLWETNETYILVFLDIAKMTYTPFCNDMFLGMLVTSPFSLYFILFQTLLNLATCLSKTWITTPKFKSKW